MAKTTIKKTDLKVKAVEHEDVTGKKQYYLVITNEQGENHFVNIGKSTYEKVTKLETLENGGNTLDNGGPTN